MPARILLVLFLLLFGASLHAQPAYKPHVLERSMRDRAMTAVQKGDTSGARELFERWLEADPRDNSSWYNYACLLSLVGDSARALDAFESAVDAGWRDAVHPTRDSDLDAIRSSPRFAAALERIRTRTASSGPRGFVRRFAEMRSRGSYIVMLPPDYEKSTTEYPVCVILHGSGSSDVGHGRLADTMGREGVIYIAPRAPYPHAELAAAGTLGWTAYPPDELAANDPNREHIQTDYVDWILTCIDDVQANYRARKGKVFVYGHSQGGGYANILALLHPERVAAYYSQAASLPSERFLNADNARRMKSEGVRAYLMHGEQDAVVPPSTSTAIDGVLTAAGVEHTLRMVPGDHGFGPVILADIREWIAKEVRRVR